jgi:hypothetical protein
MDPDVFRVVIRRNAFLDPLAVLDEDVEMQARIEKIFGEITATPRPAPGPSREELLEIIARAG